MIGDAAHCLSAQQKPFAGIGGRRHAGRPLRGGIIAGCVPEANAQRFDIGIVEYWRPSDVPRRSHNSVISLSGVVAWLAWCFVHIFFLIGEQSSKVMFRVDMVLRDI